MSRKFRTTNRRTPLRKKKEFSSVVKKKIESMLNQNPDAKLEPLNYDLSCYKDGFDYGEKVTKEQFMKMVDELDNYVDYLDDSCENRITIRKEIWIQFKEKLNSLTNQKSSGSKR